MDVPVCFNENRSFSKRINGNSFQGDVETCSSGIFKKNDLTFG